MKIDLNQFRETFFEEAAEHLATMEAALLRLESAPQDEELLNSIFRCAHSIKGGSGTFGLTDVARFTHSLEGLLDRMRDGAIQATPPLISLLLKASDVLTGLVASARTGEAPPGQVAEVLEGLQQVLNTPAAAPASAAPVPAAAALPPGQKASYQITFVPGTDLLREGMDPLLLLRDLSRLGEVAGVKADLSQLPDLAEMDPASCYLGWTLNLVTDQPPAAIEEIFSFVKNSSRVVVETLADPARAVEPQAVSTGKPGASPAPVFPARKLDDSSIRVAIDKVDRLVNLVEELVISQSMLDQAMGDFSVDRLGDLREAVGTMNRNLRDLQARVMAIRMVPISTVFGRYPRLVRELAGSLGKKIVCEMVGQETELDKQVIERMGDPLTHLLRNAADHGIESPEERERLGKPPEGTIRLAAFHQGDNIVIEVSDDGRGLDPERLRQKALALGMIGAEQELSTEETYALIFAPGFSTATTVTNVSGRGVGMDVVKKNVEGLNGTIAIASELGRGTRIRIKLPLTVAILDGLCLGLGDETFVLPLLAIVESLQPRPQQVKTVFGKGEVLLMRGETLPLLRLGRLLAVPAQVTVPSQGLVVIVESEGKKCGLLVDTILGQSQVVIKNLEKNYRKVEGIAGATILGDGQVALILDVHGLVRLAARVSSGVEETAEEEILATSA